MVGGLAFLARRDGRAQSSPTHEQGLDAAIQAFERSDLASAQRLTRAYLAGDPRSAAAWNLKGLIDDAEGNFESGGKDFVAALRLGASASVYTNLGNHFLLLHDTARAREAFFQALQLDPHHFSARLSLAHLVLSGPACGQLPAVQQRQSPDQVQALPSRPRPTPPPGKAENRNCAREALSLIRGFSASDLKRPSVEVLHVRALLAAGQRAEAVRAADTALAHGPRNPKLAYSLGLELEQGGAPRSALSFFKAARSMLPPNHVHPHLLLALAQAKFVVGDPATAEFLRLEELEPHWWQPDYYLGRIADQQRQYLQASALLVKAQELAPNEPLVAAALANTLAEQGFWFDAMDEWQRYLRLNPRDLRADRELAIVAGVAHQQEVALRSMTRYLEAYPGDSKALYMLALMELDSGRQPAARRALHACLRLKPSYAPAWTTLARTERNLGHLASAREDLGHALEADPRYAPALVALAEIQNQGGHPELALPLLQQAVKNDPNNIVAYYQLGLAERRTGHPKEAAKAAATFASLRKRHPRNPSGRGLLGYLRRDVRLTPTEQRLHYIEFLQKALQARPKDSRLLCRLGVAEIEEGHSASGLGWVKQALVPTLPYEDALATARALSYNHQDTLALQFYRLASALPSAHEDARAALGEASLLAASGHPHEALAAVDSVPAAARPKGEAADLAALIYARIGMEERAAAAFRVALALDPQRKAFYRDAAIFLGSTGQWDAALKVLDEAKRQCGASSSLLLDEAVLLQLSGRRGQAQILLKKLAFRADDPTLTSRQRLALLLLGISDYTTDRRAEAATIFRQLTWSHPDLSLAWYYRALMASESGKANKALEWLSHSLALEPKYPPALYLRGRLLADAGKFVEAQRDLEDAASADPTWSAPHYQLSRLFQRLGQTDLAKDEALKVAQLDAQAHGSQSAELREYLDGLALPSQY